MSRPACIRHYEEIRQPDDSHYPGSDELLSVGSPFGKELGLTRRGIHHEELPPGRRTSRPDTESDAEESGYGSQGRPAACGDGARRALRPGAGVAVPAGTGVAHTFINNSDETVRLLVVGEATKKSNKICYPLHPRRNEEVGEGLWKEAPQRERGTHDGMPDQLRARQRN